MKSSATKNKGDDVPKSRKPEDRWHPKFKDENWVPVLHFFLENYHRLKPYPVTHSEAMFVIHLMQFKWDSQAPYPGYKRIAKTMGVSDKSARRYAQALEQKKYLKRKIRKAQTNEFNLKPLMEALVSLKEIEEKKDAAKGRK